MKIGLVGLPKSGKTSLFNLLTGQRVPTASFGTARGEIHVGVARVPDARLERLRTLFKPRKTTSTTFEVVDLAGITKGERHELDAKEFRSADALLHVVRAFVGAAGDPAAPRAHILDLETELILADLEVVERRVERLEASLRKKPSAADQRERTILLTLKAALEGGKPIRALGLGHEESKAIRGFTFLSEKPILHCLNLDEKEVGRSATLLESFGLSDLAGRPATRFGWVSTVMEAEIAQLAEDAQAAVLADFGLPEPAIGRVLRDCYALLGLISFFTHNEDEVRAWSVRRGTVAREAAGVIHSDMARGFIRAEVVGYDQLIAAGGSMAAVRAGGQLRLEGKDYVIQDGEICHFRFTVGK